jgi:hypothetical protein
MIRTLVISGQAVLRNDNRVQTQVCTVAAKVWAKRAARRADVAHELLPRGRGPPPPNPAAGRPGRSPGPERQSGAP